MAVVHALGALLSGDAIPAMTVFVTPDVIGRLLLTAGKRLPVGAGNDVEKGFCPPETAKLKHGSIGRVSGRGKRLRPASVV